MSLARNASLTAFDLRLLMIAMVPDLDSRFERLYGYLNDDVTRRRASIGLALELAGASPTSATARRALSPSGPLVDLGLVLVEDPDRPFLTRSLRVPDRVIAHLLGDSAAEAATQLVLLDVEGYPSPLGDRLAHALGSGAGVVHIRERETGTAAATAVAALQAIGRDAVVVDLSLLVRGPDPQELVLACAREALLRDAGLVAGPVEDLAEHHAESVQRLSRWPSPVLFLGAATWDPRWSTTPPLAVEAPVLGARERISLLRDHLRTSRRRRRPGLPRRPPLPRPRAGAARRPRRPDGGPARRRPGHRRRPAERHPRPERRRARAARPPDRARGRLGRPGAGTRRTTGARGAHGPGPAPRPGARRLADAARAAAAAAA